uniref:Alpha/beta hydrolase fold-3 domain-containing protein n=1 Tax=Crocodylus porosus TaxID=8502 RepID=A0A7M4DUU6_CROPO
MLNRRHVVLQVLCNALLIVLCSNLQIILVYIFFYKQGNVLVKAGLCYEHDVLRFLVNGIPPQKTNELLINNVMFNNLTVRIYQPKVPSTGLRRGIVYCHGGVGRFGSISKKFWNYTKLETKNYKDYCGVLFRMYRLAPEHKNPAQYEDCLTAAIHFMRNPEDYGVDPTCIIIAGDSAGAYLAATTTQTLTSRPDLPKLRAQVLMYPFVQGLDFNLPSYQQYCRVPILSREQVVLFALKWLSPDNIPKEFKVRGYKPHFPTEYRKDIYEQIRQVFDPVASPLLAEDAIVCQLPETFIMTCEYDVLRDDGLLYKKRLEDSGVPVTWYHSENAFHGIINLFDNGMLTFPAGKKALDNIVNFLRGL